MKSYDAKTLVRCVYVNCDLKVCFVVTSTRNIFANGDSGYWMLAQCGMYLFAEVFDQQYGELFDLENEPCEVNNLRDDPHCLELKQELLLRYIHAELGKEPMWMPRIAGA